MIKKEEVTFLSSLLIPLDRIEKIVKGGEKKEA